MHPSEHSSPYPGLPTDSALLDSRYGILSLFENVLECVRVQLNAQSLDKLETLAQDLGIVSGELDRRLRHCSYLREEVIGLLRDIVEKVSALGDPAEPVGVASEFYDNDIEKIVDSSFHNLVVLLSTMSNPPPSDDFQRLSQASRQENMTQFETKWVQDKFPNCEPKLQRRMGVLNRLRRLRLQDSQRASGKQVAKAIERETETQTVPIRSSESAQQHQQLSGPQRFLSDRLGEIEHRSRASKIKEMHNMGDKEPLYATNTDRPLSISYLRQAFNEFPGSAIQCPFCMLKLREGMSQEELVRHIFDDVEPFMCTFGGCSQSYRTYSSREDWQQHEDSVHRISTIWICQDCDERLNSAESFEDHLKSAHHGVFGEQYLDMVTRICKTTRPDDAGRQQCIFCKVGLATKDEEVDHVALHLTDLAYFVLSRINDEEENPQGEEHPQGTMSTTPLGMFAQRPFTLQNRKLSSEKCYAHYHEAHIDNGRLKPRQAVAIEIPCPKLSCAPSPDHYWECSRCGAYLEYGHIDDLLYCNCGGCDYKWWSFRCSDSQHGLAFHAYQETELLKHLEALKPFEELNILILGAVGVGKSTWVNALVNYLTFPTLDDALAAEKLCYIIPFAFRTQYMGDYGEIQEFKVTFGFEDQNADNAVAEKVKVEERDGMNGEPATHHTTVHRVQIGDHIVRLIDTPSIGDTCGVSYDKENMANIIQVLRTYNKLHGILILLKSNESRLRTTFRFCIQELLMHLDRDAAQNVAFGFTNTRVSNYTPGDTLHPLQGLLHQYKELEIGLRERNVYCFDSESFRYLAAQKHHNNLWKSSQYLEDARTSWKRSFNESKRLIDHFRTIKPHEVHRIVNLYETRRRIAQMTESMAQIVEMIKGTIAVTEDLIKDLEQYDVTKKELEKILPKQVSTSTAVPVDRPRTVCSHKDCVEYTNAANVATDGRPNIQAVYKYPCHIPCDLNNVKSDVVGEAGLKECWALNGQDTCRICAHPWQFHLHIDYEIQIGSIGMDSSIPRSSESNATLRENQKALIANKKKFVEDLEVEFNTIRDAAARFSIFLARNAIMPTNDATLAYLDQRIEQEQDKVRAGSSTDKYNILTQYRDQYKVEIETLEQNVKRGEYHRLLDQAGIEGLIQQLSSLPHCGDQLRRATKVVDEEQVTILREKAHIIKAKSHWTGEVRASTKKKLAVGESPMRF